MWSLSELLNFVNVKAAIDSIWMNACSCVRIKLYLKSRRGWICSAGHSLLIPLKCLHFCYDILNFLILFILAGYFFFKIESNFCFIGTLYFPKFEYSNNSFIFRFSLPCIFCFLQILFFYLFLFGLWILEVFLKCWWSLVICPFKWFKEPIE